MESPREFAQAVDAAHRRTLALTDDLRDEELTLPLAENVNPFLWELGHIAFFYELFLLHELDGQPLLIANGNDLYNSFEVAHDDRWELDLPDREGTRDYMTTVFERVKARASAKDLPDRERYLYRLALNHECMHQEAFIYMRQFGGLKAPQILRETWKAEAPKGGDLPGDVEVPGGQFELGADPTASFAYDNEKWAHRVEVPSFRIARAAVTHDAFAAFVADDGYRRKELWSTPGWNWRRKAELFHPVSWRAEGSGWLSKRFDEWHPLQAHHPVEHVSWYEADAYCRWANRRLPTEAEWELAASGTSPKTASEVPFGKSRFPWGDEPLHATHANLSSTYGGCVDVGAFPQGDSAFGCRQMLGNVWEWTSSDFYPYPGYLLDHPYKEYSAPWFGDRKVLRGGSWATEPCLAYSVYRNFFQPERTDILAGFRTCAL